MIVNGVDKKKTVLGLIVFIIVALFCGWLGVFIDSVLEGQPQGETLGMVVWLILPLLATLLIRTFGGGWKDTGFSPNFKGNLVWYVLSIVLFPITMFVLIWIGVGVKWIETSPLDLKQIIPAVVGSLVTVFIKNIFEESVWRGYLTQKLLLLKLRDWQLYLIVGVVWGLWHLPYNLVFLPMSDIQMVAPISRLQFTLLNLITTFALTILYTEFFRITKSIWPMVILHTVSNAVVNRLFLDGTISVLSGKEAIISPVIGVAPLLLYVFFGLLLRRYRIKRENVRDDMI